MNRRAFQRLVQQVVERVLEDLAAHLGQGPENVEICVEDWPSEEDLRSVGAPEGETLFGLYQGVPRTERSVFDVTQFPDRIVLYQGPIEESARTPAEIRKIVRDTVIHEIAHHFGIPDERLIELDAY